jgi:hypothetical protein
MRLPAEVATMVMLKVWEEESAEVPEDLEDVDEEVVA